MSELNDKDIITSVENGEWNSVPNFTEMKKRFDAGRF
jgi:hypothetical protein